jgi:hypothetical protein
MRKTRFSWKFVDSGDQKIATVGAEFEDNHVKVRNKRVRTYLPKP